MTITATPDKTRDQMGPTTQRLLKLLRHAAGGDSGQIVMAKSAMARALGVKETAVNSAINSLAHSGHVEVVVDSTGTAGGNMYKLIPPSGVQLNYETARFQARREVLKAADLVVRADRADADMDEPLDRLGRAVDRWAAVR